MTRVAGRVPVGSEEIRALFVPIAEELGEVEEVLRRELRSRYPVVDRLVRHGQQLGGKRLRPALVLLAGRAAGELTPEHTVVATVVEMIHTATLVHDDVLDGADRRRHLATLNASWGNHASVLVGDFLFTHAFYLASTLGSTYACTTIGRATNTVCEGELRQIGHRGDFELSEDDYLSIISAKTAELCACCCRLGAHYAGGSEEAVETLAAFGRDLGIAFQIVDDLLDLEGDEVTTGKSLGTDLEQQKPTLPVIRLLGQLASADRERLLELLRDGSVSSRAALDEWMADSDALDYARRRAEEFATQARKRLELLPESPSRAVLELMTHFVLERRH